MASKVGSSLAQNHVGSNHNVNSGVIKFQFRPCTLDLRGAGAFCPSDRRACSQAFCLPVSLGRSTRRDTRRIRAADASNFGDSSASSSFDAISTQPSDSSTDGRDATPVKPKGPSSLPKRAIFGTILGTSGAVVILLGGWVYAAVTCLVAYQCSKEFMGLVNAKGISEGMKPPPPVISSAISLSCVALNAWAFTSGGNTASAMAVATFIVLSLQLVASRKPRFAQLTSAVFGLVYCGYLPSFWIKLRWLAIPALHSTVIQNWQSAVGGVTQATVGVVACFMTVACIIAADTGAYFCGKSLGKTKLISISPKKTVEGAIGGLLSSIGVALALFKYFAWPDNPVSAAALGTVIFVSSLFGDLIESVIKRDAGLKDASNLIPGHGGLLDRMDSYLFTGACVYFFIRYCIRGYGVL
jgi:phosphatidate cytidylyltransferase